MMPMSRVLLIMLLAAALPSFAQDDQAADDEPNAIADTDGTAGEPAETVEEVPAPVDPDAPKLLSGMSILGNEEAPKSLVIIPWKSSEIGSDLGLSDGLDDGARPVDKEVFLRELAFYKIRAGD